MRRNKIMSNLCFMYLFIGSAVKYILVSSIDIADSVFDQSWISEVEYVETLTPSQLWEALFNDSRPIKTLLPSLLDVQKLWTNVYLAEKFGDELLQTEPGRENRTTDYCDLVRLGERIECTADDYAKSRDLRVFFRLSDFIENMSVENFDRYVITMLPSSMSVDLPFLPAFSCGLHREYYPIDKAKDPLHNTQVKELNFWFSKGSTVSTLHYDMNHQIMCQIDGQKEWRFWDLRVSENSKSIPMWSGFYKEGVFSSDDAPIDPLSVDLEKYPEFINAKWTNTTLLPGECLLVPSRHWLHFVRAPEGRNMGFSVHVSSHRAMANVYECDASDASKLSEFQVLWPFPGDVGESGFETIRMGMGNWKEIAFHAISQFAKHQKPIRETIAEITNNRSEKSKRIAHFLKKIEQDNIMEIFNFGPLWREVLELIP